MDKLYAISIITGDIFTIQEDDVKILFDYQIPLKKMPKSNCGKCYGRGWTSIDDKNGLHHLCSCLSKCFIDGFKIKELNIALPRLAK